LGFSFRLAPSGRRAKGALACAPSAHPHAYGD